MDKENQAKHESAEFMDPMDPRTAFGLVCQGHFLQKEGHKINAVAGESYPQAVLRIINSLPEEKRALAMAGAFFSSHLGVEDAPTDQIRARWSGRF